MKALAVLLALATTAHAGAFVPPKLYAAMFERGHRWTFDVTTKVQMSDGTRSKDASVLTCEVAEVRTYAKAVASKITCDRELDSNYAFVPSGLWVATAKGLARLPDVDLPDAIGDSTPVIPAAPRTHAKRTKDDEGGYYVEKVFAKGKQWCAAFDALHVGAGDPGMHTLCFTPGVGLAWGELDYRGGDPRDVVYTARD